MVRYRDTFIVFSAILIAIGILIGSRTLYSSIFIRLIIVSFFSIYYYKRAIFKKVRIFSILLVWAAFLVSLFIS